MKQCFAALLTAASLLTPTAFARLGETEAEIQARYGTPKDLNSDSAALPAKRQTFHFKGFTIIVSFVDGKSVCEVILKTEDTKLDSDEISGLLVANAAKGQTWKKDRQGFWRRSDGRAVARYYAGMMEIYTADWERKLNGILDALGLASGHSTAQQPTKPIDPSTLTYRVAEGGTTRLFDIIIPQKFATEAGLIAVAKRLDKDTASLPVVAVEIYDNAKAESLVTSGKIDDSNEKFCQRHELASYERNLTANINRLRLYEVVTKGKKKEISFAIGEPTGGIFSHQ